MKEVKHNHEHMFQGVCICSCNDCTSHVGGKTYCVCKDCPPAPCGLKMKGKL